MLKQGIFCILLVLVGVVAAKEGGLYSDKIAQFRDVAKFQVYPNSSYMHNFIRDDGYVLQWLKKGNMNVDRTRNYFMEHLAWRSENHIDQILSENWDFYKSEYPFFINTNNKSSLPVVEIWFSEWNIRRAVMSGQSKQIIRWVTYIFEMTQRTLIETRPELGSVRGALEIADMEGFNAWQHSCVSCQPMFLQWSWLWEWQYPNIWEKVYMINVTPLFRTFLNTLENSSNQNQKRTLQLYSYKNEWMPILDKNIDKNLRSTKFGGSLQRGWS